MNLADLRAHVSQHLDDADASYTTAEIDAAINEGLALFAYLTLCLQKTTNFAVTAATGLYHVLPTLPDYLVPLRVSANGLKVRPARFADLDALDQRWPGTVGSTPTRYVPKGLDLMIFYPRSNQTLSLTYGRAATLLVGDGDVPEIPELYHHSLADYGTYRPLAAQGGSMLVKASGYLKSYMDVVTAAATLVRARYRSLQYDTLPLELAHAKGKKTK